MRLSRGAGAATVGAEPTWPEGRVTLEAAEPVPFWQAIDPLCAAGGLQRRFPPAGDHFFPFKPPFEWTLVPAKARPPASDTGALRVELLRVRHDRERGYGHDEPDSSPDRRPTARKPDPETGAIVGSSYRAELLVSAEPRLRIFGVGRVEEAEAIDDRGRSLLRTPTAEEQGQELAMWQMNPHLDPRLHPALRFGSGFRASMKSWPISVPLSYPYPPVRRIARLRGVIPVVVLARRPDPLVIDLKGASGKVFSAGSTRITIHEIEAESGREPTVDFTLETPAGDNGETIMVCDTKGVRMAVNRPIDLMGLGLEVLDSRGERLFWQSTRAPTERTQGRMAIVVHDRNSKRERPEGPRLRYWGMIGRLGAESFDDRVAAYKALERLGGEALPALRAAADARDPRVRSRVRALIDSIGRRVETDRFSRPTMIRLDFRDRPLGEVVAALNERHDLGMTLRLGPEPRRGMRFFDPDQPGRLKELRDRAITLEAARPVPFREAVDRLCEAASLRYDVSPRTGFGTGPGSLVLMADRTGRGPVSDSGPFRVQVIGVRSRFERDFTLDPDPAAKSRKPAGTGDLTVPSVVIPEPGLMLHQDGPCWSRRRSTTGVVRWPRWLPRNSTPAGRTDSIRS